MDFGAKKDELQQGVGSQLFWEDICIIMQHGMELRGV